jgi:membrane fusion protein (multidrug efflux system)
VVKDAKVKLSPIDIGQRGPSTVQVLKGLHEGDTVVTSNMLRLTPGAEVDFVKVR